MRSRKGFAKVVLIILLLRAHFLGGSVNFLSESPLVQIKLQGIDISPSRSSVGNDANSVIRQILKNYPTTKLDPQYSEISWNWDNVIRIKEGICSLLRKEVSPNCFFVHEYQAEFDNSKKYSMLEIMNQINMALGIPTLTWLPSGGGYFDDVEDNMILRLEVMPYHIALALFNFLRTFDWNKLAIAYNQDMPSSRKLVEELRNLQSTHNENMKDSNIEITLEYGFSSNCEKTCFEVFDKFLEKIKQENAKIIFFDGTLMDYNNLMSVLDVNHDRIEMFDKTHVWILSPGILSKVEITNSGEILDFSENDIRIPGMFGLALIVDEKAKREYREFAQRIWLTSYLKLYEELGSSSNRNKTNRLCEDNHPWSYGRRFFALMKNTRARLWDNEPDVGFNEKGYLDSMCLQIVNAKSEDNKSLVWSRVGNWKMNTVNGKYNSSLTIDGVYWPGGKNKPPNGKPERIVLKAVILKEEPFLMYTKIQNNRNCGTNSLLCHTLDPGSNRVNYKESCCAGFVIDLLKELMKDLNFDVHLYEVPDGLWGGYKQNSWNGLINEILIGNADFTLSSLKITPKRSEVVDFSVPFLETGIGIAVASKGGTISPTAFLEPYDYTSWMFILIFMVHATAASQFLYEWLSPNGLNRGQPFTEKHNFSLFRAFWLTWSILFGAAVNADNPRGVASRFVANIWALFSLVFLASYTANLAAFMISKDSYLDFSGLNDHRLRFPKRYNPPTRFSVIPNGASEETIKFNFPDMAKYMKQFNVTNLENALTALKQDDLDAFLYDSNVLDYWAAKDDNCELRTTGNLYAMTGYGFAFLKKSIWKSKFDERILEYQKSGNIKRWKRFWLYGACKKEDNMRKKNKTLGVKNFISAYILLLCGAMACILIISCECVLFKFFWTKVKTFDKFECCGRFSISAGDLLSRRNDCEMNEYSGLNKEQLEGRNDTEAEDTTRESDQLKSELERLRAELRFKDFELAKYHSYLTLEKFRKPNETESVQFPNPSKDRQTKDSILKRYSPNSKTRKKKTHVKLDCEKSEKELNTLIGHTSKKSNKKANITRDSDPYGDSIEKESTV